MSWFIHAQNDRQLFAEILSVFLRVIRITNRIHNGMEDGVEQIKFLAVETLNIPSFV